MEEWEGKPQRICPQVLGGISETSLRKYNCAVLTVLQIDQHC